MGTGNSDALTLHTHVTLEPEFSRRSQRQAIARGMKQATGSGVSAQIIQPGTSSHRQSVCQLTAPGVGRAVEQTLFSEAIQVAVKGTAVWGRSKPSYNVIRPKKTTALREDH
jgi:hypothetical protein